MRQFLLSYSELLIYLVLASSLCVNSVGSSRSISFHGGRYFGKQNNFEAEQKSSRGRCKLFRISGGCFGNSLTISPAGRMNDDSSALEMRGSPSGIFDGLYIRTSEVNGKPHYEKVVENRIVHLYWTGSQWNLHYDIDPSLNIDNLLAYAKVRVDDPKDSGSHWYVKMGKTFRASPSIGIWSPGTTAIDRKVKSDDTSSNALDAEFLGVPSSLFPLYIAFMLDAIAVGLAMPLLPFYVMELGANAFQLSIVVSANYAAQMIGCVVMGQVSDIYGRRPVLYLCLAASSLSYFAVSRAQSLVGVALARIISGSFGGLVPVMQSCVADVASQQERPKYMGRIMATFGMGFVLGPALSALLPGLSTRQKIRIAALLPLCGLIVSVLLFKETKRGLSSINWDTKADDKKSIAPVLVKQQSSQQQQPKTAMKTEVMLLILNGFLLMYAFATETIYAMFIKDSFGHGERVLSTVFAVNGLFIGLFQVFFIKPMVSCMGKHATLAAGDILLALGMVGVALVRSQIPHFLLFTAHIVGYSIADTALVSLISRYSAADTQGRDLAFNQAAQACARVLSPVIAGLLYERSKSIGLLPVGALPFLAGALFPAVGVAVPVLLYIWSVNKKRMMR